MSGYDITQVLSVPGRLVVGPTQNGMLGAYPYSGTGLGYVERFAVKEDEESFDVVSEVKAKRVAWGAGVLRVSVSFVSIQFDPNVLNNLYAKSTVSAGGFQGANVLSLPDVGRTLQPGLRAAGQPLLFAADDPAHPSLLILAPFWSRGGRREFDMRKDNPLEQAVVVVVGEDANGNDLRMDLIENLSLT